MNQGSALGLCETNCESRADTQEGSSWLRWVRAQLRWYSGKDLCCLYTPSKVSYIHILISSRSVVTWVWIIKNLPSRAKFATQPKGDFSKAPVLCKFSFTDTCSFTPYKLPETWDDILWLEGHAAHSHLNTVLCECLSLIFAWLFFFSQKFSSLEIPGNLDTQIVVLKNPSARVLFKTVHKTWLLNSDLFKASWDLCRFKLHFDRIQMIIFSGLKRGIISWFCTYSQDFVLNVLLWNYQTFCDQLYLWKG